MHLSTPLALALAGLTTAAPLELPPPIPTSVTFDLSHAWTDTVLHAPSAALDIHLAHASLSAPITVAAAPNFPLDPTVRIGLGGVRARVALDIAATAAAQHVAPLLALPALALALPGLAELALDTAVALDLVVAVDAAAAVSAAIEVEFPADAAVQVSLLTRGVVGLQLDGVVARPLGVGVAAHAVVAPVNVQVGLRLRTHVGVDVEVEQVLGVPEVESEAELAVWVDLFSWTAALAGGEGDACVLQVQQAVDLGVGVGVQVGVEVEDLLEIELTPELPLRVAALAEVNVCQPDFGVLGPWLFQ